MSLSKRDDVPQTVTFSNDDGELQFTLDLGRETIWASQKQIAQLFGVGVPAISKHISSVFTQGELSQNSVVSKMETTASDGKSYSVDAYNLDVIISVGYRVNSRQATRFRQWATKQIRELITKGFALDENRFANAQLGAFEELVERVRAIRTSERNFFRKITDIFSTSSDYDPTSQTAKQFFASIQNKFHFASHGHTAAELIVARADAEKRNMGLTSIRGAAVTTAEAAVAKNYLGELEIKKLELLSEQFLSYAELRYVDKHKTTMAEWASKLDDFLAFNEKPLLRGNGSVSRLEMLQKIETELSKYKAKQLK